MHKNHHYNIAVTLFSVMATASGAGGDAEKRVQSLAESIEEWYEAALEEIKGSKNKSPGDKS